MADVPRQSASGTGIAQAYGERASAIVNVGLRAEDIAPLLQAAGVAQQAKIDELAKQMDVSRGALLGFFKILKEDEVPLEQLAAKLGLVAQRHNDLLGRLGALDPEDEVARGLIESAREVIRNAASSVDYGRADDLLFRAEEAQDRTISGAEALEREAHEAARRLRLSKANTRAERAELSLTRLDYLQAAEHFSVASEFVGPDNLLLKLNYRSQSAGALESYGYEKGENEVLARAIGVFREVLNQWPDKDDSEGYATAQNSLGVALWRLGDRESGTTRLEEALTIFRVLAEYTREHATDYRAIALDNMGIIMLGLSEREGGTTLLKLGISAMCEALTGISRKHSPLNWAKGQNNLGLALVALGNEENDAKHLEEGIKAYRAAIRVYARDHSIMDWAHTQYNLGRALRDLGELKNRTDLFEKAAVELRAALSKLPRERAPLFWANTQRGLGQALVSLGERESDTGRLEEAIVACRASLEECTRERSHLDWARTQFILGSALSLLGQLEQSNERLEQAVDAIQLSWSAYQEAGINRHDGDFESHLAKINELIASGRYENSEMRVER